MTAAAFMAGCTALTVRGNQRTLCLSAGAQYDRRVNREGQASAGVLADLQTVRQYLKALTDSGQLANFQSLTPG
jgi:hypothetical protein